MYRSVRRMACLVGWAALLLPAVALAKAKDKPADLWALKPVVRPEAPAGLTASANPIDAFVAARYKAKGLTPVGPADKRTLLRRVHLDLTGLPPTPAEQDAFLADQSTDAYEKVIDRLLASEQHGVRYARHWLDVLRYADADERMIAAPGIHFWRDWVIGALNNDLPYDQFVRAQLTGYRSTARTQMSATGHRFPVERRADDQFALGLLARGAVIRDGGAGGELPMAAVDTVSTAFMGITVACAMCHDHLYDPVSQRNYYEMKALFDPLVPRKVLLGTPAEVFAAGRAQDEADRRRAAAEGPLNDLVAPYRKRLYDERVAMLPDDVRVVILKPEKQRSTAEQKTADDYFPVLRIDVDKFLEIMPEEDRKKFHELQRQVNEAGGGRGGAIPAFWTVEPDPKKELEKSYVLTSGDPTRPEKDKEVAPGWPFAPPAVDFREGRVEAFSDWLTAPENPLFARVAVNRLWQWHFGEGLQRLPSDFGALGGKPSNPALLEWLASEFVRRGFSMKAMHRLIVTSDTYRLSSEADPALHAANIEADPENFDLWRFRLRRLEAEPIWDAIHAAAGLLDASVGGPSFDPGNGAGDGRPSRRAAYMVRGYSTNRDVVPHFLQSFDVDDGRVPCPVRGQTVTAPQALFLMNGDEIERATARFAERLLKDSGGNLAAAVESAYRAALARPPTSKEMDGAMKYLENDPARLKGLVWLMFNLDEFVYVR